MQVMIVFNFCTSKDGIFLFNLYYIRIRLMTPVVEFNLIFAGVRNWCNLCICRLTLYAGSIVDASLLINIQIFCTLFGLKYFSVFVTFNTGSEPKSDGIIFWHVRIWGDRFTDRRGFQTIMEKALLTLPTLKEL